jgi:hypothetical protein
MIFSNSFRVVWWFLVTGAVFAFLWSRYSDLVAGRAVPADIVVFLIWVGLMLVPIFREVSLWGMKLKQEVQELRRDVATQFEAIRAEVRQAVDVKTNITQHLQYTVPPPDEKLPELEERIKRVVAETLRGLGVSQEQAEARDTPVGIDDIDPNAERMMKTRFKIEKEIRRIAQGRELISNARRPSPVQALVRELTTREIIEPQLANAIREVYSVCSLATHAQDITAAQADFVRDTGPQVIWALRAIS